jgi:drug/metabolite transporter (DMT)-like permease
MYVPVCFAYIIPMARNGGIPKEQLDLPYKPFAVMGGLDAVAGIMQVFAATYLPGPMIILLQQSAIPISMVISKYLINAQYNKYQYVGAVIVACGIVVVLAPTISGGGDVVWAIVMMVSCVPMTLSSVYKEISLGETELDTVRP